MGWAGLGLAIVKAIALMHGGDVYVSVDGFNTFGLTLPVRVTDEPFAVHPSAQPTGVDIRTSLAPQHR